MAVAAEAGVATTGAVIRRPAYALSACAVRVCGCGARRGFFSHWGYDLDPALYDFGSFITDDYRAILAEVVTALIPEPATIALLGLGGLAILRKRR
ncbi:MAG: PEP-CTERM sorting domain-containing protein [Phycisphaerales bacterium]|nr:MAG: PEP-CTERM sorting domain-containing protein [Phycisphaerales bacterium]